MLNGSGESSEGNTAASLQVSFIFAALKKFKDRI